MTTATAEPFESLDAMKARHAELLRTTSTEESAADLRARVIEFLERGKVTGLILDNPTDRRIAQGLLDYWKATLYTQLRDEKTDLTQSIPFDTILADFPETDSEKLAADAERTVAALSEEDREVARRILLRLVRLAPGGREFHPTSVPRAALDEIGNVGQVVRVMHALETAGVIRVVSSSTPGDEHVELAAAHLIRTWPRYTDWLKIRLALRTAAYLWKPHQSLYTGLISGRQLVTASTYRDLDGVEGDYLAASRSFVERGRRIRFWGGIGILLVIIGVLVAMIIQERNRRRIAEDKEEFARNAARLKQQLTKEEQEKSILQQRQSTERVFNLNRMIRALSDIVATKGPYEQLALWRWEELERELRRDPELKRFLDKQEHELREVKAQSSPTDRGIHLRAIARAIRSDSLRKNDREVIDMMMSVRDESYGIVKRLASSLDEAAGEHKKFTDASVTPYYREFLRYYWGAMSLVESRQVEKAMVDFKYGLDDWENSERDKTRSWEAIRKNIAAQRKNLEERLNEDLKLAIVISEGESVQRK